jgi:hypothetical protein
LALDRAAVAVRDLTLRTPTLDDVFLDLTGSRIDTEGDERDTGPAAGPEPVRSTDTLEAVR